MADPDYASCSLSKVAQGEMAFAAWLQTSPESQLKQQTRRWEDVKVQTMSKDGAEKTWEGQDVFHIWLKERCVLQHVCAFIRKSNWHLQLFVASNARVEQNTVFKHLLNWGGHKLSAQILCLPKPDRFQNAVKYMVFDPTMHLFILYTSLNFLHFTRKRWGLPLLKFFLLVPPYFRILYMSTDNTVFRLI